MPHQPKPHARSKRPRALMARAGRRALPLAREVHLAWSALALALTPRPGEIQEVVGGCQAACRATR